MLVEINPNNIDDRLIQQAVKILRKGGLIIFPTDTVYAIGCDLNNKKALNALASFKGLKLKKTRFSIICYDIRHLSEYVKHIDRPAFKTLNKSLPGPFTFILQATNEIPRLFDTKRKEIGIRIPDNNIIREIVKELGNPVVTTSLHDKQDSIKEYFIDPYVIYERFDDKVDLIIDGGSGLLETSTVVDLSKGELEIIRQGIGELEI